ncbi:unnamed protein product [Mycena citricolor]|uniref:Uncharacterized protein n=1 Tax=Mycena citricolor TaxID=2018698 RepID=A0AAD2K6H6_9AGAR|nr:unnamed protein product [Mycena citricolor]
MVRAHSTLTAQPAGQAGLIKVCSPVSQQSEPVHDRGYIRSRGQRFPPRVGRDFLWKSDSGGQRSCPSDEPRACFLSGAITSSRTRCHLESGDRMVIKDMCGRTMTMTVRWDIGHWTVRQERSM